MQIKLKDILVPFHGIGIGGKSIRVKTGNPKDGCQFRVHPEAMIECVYLCFHPTGEYLVNSEVGGILYGNMPNLSKVTLYQGIDKAGVNLVLKVPEPWNDDYTWKISMLEAINDGRESWIERVVLLNNSKEFRYVTLENDETVPQWPECDFMEIVQSGFDGKYIDRLEHPLAASVMAEVLSKSKPVQSR